MQGHSSPPSKILHKAGPQDPRRMNGTLISRVRNIPMLAAPHSHASSAITQVLIRINCNQCDFPGRSYSNFNIQVRIPAPNQGEISPAINPLGSGDRGRKGEFHHAMRKPKAPRKVMSPAWRRQRSMAR